MALSFNREPEPTPSLVQINTTEGATFRNSEISCAPRVRGTESLNNETSACAIKGAESSSRCLGRHLAASHHSECARRHPASDALKWGAANPLVLLQADMRLTLRTRQKSNKL